MCFSPDAAFHLLPRPATESRRGTTSSVSPDAGVLQVICNLRSLSLATLHGQILKTVWEKYKVKTFPAVFLFVSALSFLQSARHSAGNSPDEPR